MARKTKIPEPRQAIKIESQDPDSWLRKLRTPDAVKKWLQGEQDYISDYMLLVCQAEANGPRGVAEQVKRMGELIEAIPDDTLRSAYFNDVKENWTAFRKIYKLKRRETDVPLPKLEKLEKDDKSAFFDFGFWEKDASYYTLHRGKEMRICNFTIDVLYFVRSENQPKYVCRFRNMFGGTRITAVTTDDFTSVGTFKKVVGRLGYFVFEGTDEHLNKIKLKILHGVRDAYEPKYMGYSSHGDFYTWSNGLYFDGQFYPSDKYGMVELEHPISTVDDFKNLPAECQVKFGDELHILDNPEKFIEKNGEDVVSQYIDRGEARRLSFYFLPFSTKLKISEHDDDDFEFERRFRHTPKTKEVLTFEKWADLMVKVYGDNGCVGVVYYCMSLFRDIIFRHNNSYIPLLGSFGPRQSGKSTYCRSLNMMFGESLPDGINLESGSTATGIRRYLASAQNALLWLNEYKNSLPDHTLGMIKGIADGSGKLTGRNTGGNETKTYAPRCAVVVAGQDVPTKDPAILSRMIICEFDGKDRDYQAFEELTRLEKDLAGTAVTLQVLNYRADIKKHYSKTEATITAMLRTVVEDQLEVAAEDRILLNNSSLLAVYKILGDAGLKFPFDQERLLNALIQKVAVQISIQHTSDDVEQYFNIIQSLIDGNQVKEGDHYKIIKEAKGLRFYLRVRPIHPNYMAAAQRAGMVALTLGTITQYLRKHRSFLDYKDQGVTFGKLTSRTSAFIFDYDVLLSQGIEFKTAAEPTPEL